MKKEYIEPTIVVEDFAVSEMIAADCAIPEKELLVVEQMSHKGCDNGREPKYWVDGKVDGKHNGKGTAYAFFSDRFREGTDLNGNGYGDVGEETFTAAYRSPGVCAYDPTEHGVTFGYGYVCNDDVSALQKS